MSMKQEDWKPQVGKTAWTMITIGVVREVIVVSHYGQVKDYFEVKGKLCQTSRHKDDLYPTAEAAISGIRVYDLEGKEVQVARAMQETEALAMRIMLSDEAGQQNYSWEYCLQMAERQRFAELGKNQDGRTDGGC